MRRRTVLASAAAVALAGLGGCAVRLDDPTIKAPPVTPVTPAPPTPLPGSAEVAALESAAEIALRSAAAAPGADTASLTKLAAVRSSHAAVLATPAPLWREATVKASPPPATPAASKEAGAALATTALVALRDATTARAVAAEGLDAVLWASLAASADQARLWLGVPVGAITPAVAGRVVSVRDDPVALDVLVERYHEAVYGFSSLLGFLPNSSTLRPVLGAQLTAARTRRDALVAYARATSANPTPGAGAYSLSPLPADQVVVEAAALLVAVTQAAGSWVASATASRRARATSELIYAAGAGLPLGAGLAEWPGWPD